MRAVIDRFVDGEWAILLVGDAEIEYNVPLEKIPADAKESSIVDVTIENGVIMSLKVLDEDTQEQQTRINEKLNQLKSRQRSNFKKN